MIQTLKKKKQKYEKKVGKLILKLSFAGGLNNWFLYWELNSFAYVKFCNSFVLFVGIVILLLLLFLLFRIILYVGVIVVVVTVNVLVYIVFFLPILYARWWKKNKEKENNKDVWRVVSVWDTIIYLQLLFVV